MKNIPFKAAFEVLQDREAFFDKINKGISGKELILAQVLLMALFTFFYGLIMGSYNSWQQSLLTGVKLWLLLMTTLIICLPSFYIVQLVLGSKITLKQLVLILLSGFVMTTTIMLAFAPIVLYFQLSGDNYQFLQLLHVFVFIFSGFFGMRVVLEALKSAFENNQIYPKIGLTVFRIWVVIFAFVGIQLSWNLRPFVGSKNMPFELFRTETKGNFYSTIFGGIGELFEPKKEKSDEAN
ncbi:MAG: hypothetical protein ACR2MX_09815 [Cyclobacteriaceae bacterium]